MRKGQEGKDAILRRMERLANSKANDAVKLAYLTAEQAAEIDGMNLDGLIKFKRHGNGAVEVTLVDKRETLEKLYEMMKGNGNEELDAFLGALEK